MTEALALAAEGNVVCAIDIDDGKLAHAKRLRGRPRDQRQKR